jgi:HlyD family secretion protein
VLNPAQPFLTLVPNDAVMEVDGAIPASDVGFVRVGDSVVLKFGAYEFREHGYAEGSVRTIAPDSQSNPTDNTDGGKFAPQESKIDSVPLGAEVYRVKISIDTLKMYNLPQDFRLQPGLAVTGDVKVGKRTMLSYMLGRFAPMLTEGMREP